MLARIADLPCGSSAEVDRSGALLRLRVAVEEREACTSSLIARLADAGYEARELEAAAVAAALESVERWYTLAEVAELSREEAGALASRIAGGFVERTGLTAQADGVARVLEARILEALLESARTGRVSLITGLDAWLTHVRGDLASHLDTTQQAALEASVRTEIERLRADS